MGKTESKLEKPNANVINEVEIKEDKINIQTIEICMVIITIVSLMNLVIHLYALHNKKLKKKYLSMANQLDKI